MSNNKKRRVFLLLLLLLGVAGSLWAAFPGVAFNLWIDFEACTNGSAPTNVQLTNSCHSCAGTWSNASDAGLITAQTTAQCPLSAMGDTGTLGMQYSSATGAVGYEHYTITGVAPVSVGFCLRTSDQHLTTYNFQEGPHVLTFVNAGLGQLWRASDERSGSDNTRQIRLSAGNNRVPVTDLTWYWVTMKYVANGTVSLSVYNITAGSIGTLVGAVTSTDTSNSTVTSIELGNYQITTAALAYTELIDDVIMDTATAAFPLLPGGASCTPTLGLLGVGRCG